jgi:hypothetical protein
MSTPDNNEMKRTSHGANGGSPLVSVFDGLESWREVMKAVLIAMVTVALAQNQQEPCPAATPVPRANLVVQAVDQTWLPVPGATVRLRGAGKGSASFKAVTDPNGLAYLLAPAGVYTLDAELVGFKIKPLKNLKVAPVTNTPQQVQLVLRVAGPYETIQ